MKKIKIKSFQVGEQNLFIDTNHPDYKWIKKHYNDPDVSDSEREWADFDDSFTDVKVGKHLVKYIAPNTFPKQAIETIAIVSKSKGKDLIVDKLVQCRFMYDGLNTYEIIGLVDKDKTEFNKDGVIVLKQKKL